MFTQFATASVTRPANTTQYAAGDAVGNAAGDRLTFSQLPDFTKRGALIESAVLISSANQGTKPDLELWLFQADPTGIAADNDPFNPTDAQMLNLVGVIDFLQTSFKSGTATSGAGGNACCVTTGLAITFKAHTLYGVLVERETYTPVSAEVFTVNLGVVQ